MGMGSSLLTSVQLEFFLNREDGEELILSDSEEFEKYLFQCCVFNMLKNLPIDSKEGSIFWNDDTQDIFFAFPAAGEVYSKLRKLGYIVHFEMESDEDEEC